MKWLLILLLIGSAAAGQTVHIKDKNIVYKGTEEVNDLSLNQLMRAAQKAIVKTKNKNVSFDIDSSQNEMLVKAAMKIKSDRRISNSIQYHLKLKLKDNGYQYKIDSVVMVRKERGYKTTTLSSEELIKLLEVTGPVATATEGELGQVDMRFQELLDRIKNYLKK